jgi:dTDP-4-amino-4,6-dideoxygalactose transaminase
VAGDAAAVVPVHLYGQMADMRSMRAIADRAGLALIEDAAQALGAAQRIPEREGWTPAGRLGDAGCFSFFPSKNLGAWGEGGMVVTDDPILADRLRRLRNHGETDRGRHVEVGWNSRLQELQAAVLDAKLEKLDEWNGRRRAHAAAYDRALEDVEGLRPPVVRAGNRHVYQQYTVRCRDREAVRGRLTEAGVETGVYYPTPCHLQEPLASLGYGEDAFPAAEEAADEVLSLPVFPTMREEERERVIEALRAS